MSSLTRLAAAVVLTAAAIGSIAATETPTTDVLHLRQLGDDCSGSTLLSPTAGSDEINCGYIGGFAFGEVFETAEVDTSKTYTDFELDPVTLDATRDLSTTITIGSYDGVSGPGDVAGGIGEVRIIGTISAKIDGSRTTLHSFDVTELTNPAEDTHEFVLTQDLGDELDRVEADDFQLVLTVRGVHAAHGFVEVNGNSHVDIPTVLIEEDTDETVVEGEDSHIGEQI